MPNTIEFRKNYTRVIDEVYQEASVSRILTSGRRIAREGRSAHEIMIPKISVSGLGDYTRNVGYKTGNINIEYETRAFNYDRGVKMTADVMDVEEGGVFDCFVEAGAELQRSHVAPEADAFAFAQIASHDGVTYATDDFGSAEAGDVLAKLREVTSYMDENHVTATSRILFITPTLRGLLDDFSNANPTRSNRVLERFSQVVDVPQSRFYTKIDLLSGDDDRFGYQRAVGAYEKTTDTEVDSEKTYYTYTELTNSYAPVASPTKSGLTNYYECSEAAGTPINFLVVEKSAVIKFDKHVVSRVFDPDELENLDSYMMKYRKYGIVELFDNKTDGVFCSSAPSA